jgi:flagellar motor protein MotB
MKNASIEELNKSSRKRGFTQATKEWLESVQTITEELDAKPQDPKNIELIKFLEKGLSVVEFSNPYGDMPSIHLPMAEVRKLIKQRLVPVRSPEYLNIYAEYELKMEGAANEQEEKSIVAQYKSKLAAAAAKSTPSQSKEERLKEDELKAEIKLREAQKAETKKEETKKEGAKKEETKKEGAKKEGAEKQGAKKEGAEKQGAKKEGAEKENIRRAPVEYGLPYLRNSLTPAPQSLEERMTALFTLIKSRVKANPVVDEWMYTRKIIDWKQALTKLPNGLERTSIKIAIDLFEDTVLPVEWEPPQTPTSIESLKKLSVGELAQLAPEVLHSIPKDKLELLPLGQLELFIREQANLNDPIDIEQIRKINFKTLDAVDVDVIMLEVNNHYSAAAFEKKEAIAYFAESAQLTVDPYLLVHVPRAELKEKYKLSIPKSTEEKFIRNAAYKKEVEAKCLDAGITPIADLFKLSSHTL